MSNNTENKPTDDITINSIPSEQINNGSLVVDILDIAINSDKVDLKENMAATSENKRHASSNNMQKTIDFLSHYKDRKEIIIIIDILKKIEEELLDYGKENLFKISASENEDGIIGVSWEIGDALLGFTLRPDEIDSTWFLIVGEKDKKWRTSGDIETFDENKVFNSIISILK